MPPYTNIETPAVASTPVVPATLLSGRVGLLPPQVFGDDLLQSPAGDFVDAGFSATGGVALSVGEGVQGERPVGNLTGTQDDAPRPIGPGNASLDAAAEFGSVSALGLAAQQARLGQATVAVDFAARTVDKFLTRSAARRRRPG